VIIPGEHATDAPVDATCTVSIKDTVHNKRGESVPSDQRDYTFKLLPMEFRFAVPDPAGTAPGEILLSPAKPLEFFFTAALKANGTIGTGAGQLTLTTLDTSKVEIIAAPNKNITVDNPDGEANTDVCDGAGAPVPVANIRSYRRASAGQTTALVMRLDVGGPTEQVDEVWAPLTTYRVKFLDGATVAPQQGGAAGALPVPDDYTLCFHTSAM
jgi:hypothetical protein